MTTAVEAPILVIGTHRSGTTLLGRALPQHPEVCYWEEPRHVWSWGHNFRGDDDRLTAVDATPRIKAHIQRQFARYLASSGRARFAEKTPSNCLRLEFIDQVFPDALFIHVFRDGRAVVHSTDVVTRTRILPDRKWYAVRRLLGTPVWEWPAMVPRFGRTFGRRLIGADMAYWGPQPPGWREWLRQDDRLVVLAKQWRHTLEPVLEWRDRVSPSRWLDVRYEELVREPGRYAREIERFARLAPSAEFRSHLEDECHADRVDAWRSAFEDGALEALRPVLEPPLERLGYEW